MAFYVGQKVVLVDEFDHRILGLYPNLERVVLPRCGLVYTVRDTQEVFGRPHIRLSEIRNPVIEFRDHAPMEPTFGAARFRPVVERKTDISIFTAMLTPSDERVSS